jgi:hypothetical protein
MNPDNQNFESLQRLLKLKRYEPPPPRYFGEFSGRVINRLRADAPEGRSQSSANTAEISWLQRVLSVLDAKPLFAGAFGAVVVGVLVGGAVYSDETGVPEAASSLAVSQMPLPVAVTPTPVAAPVAIGSSGGAFAFGGSSTNARSLFDAIGTPSVQQGQLIDYSPFRQ